MLELTNNFTGITYRSHDPRWPFAPISGEGAARHGGRFNPKGQPALYLSLSQVGALLESQQRFPKRAEPKLICSYDIDMKNVIDLTDSHILNQLNYSTREIVNCAWLFESQKGQMPYTWKIFEDLFRQKVNGIIVPSCCAEGADLKNLVLWHWSDELPNKISVIDSHKQLPNDQSSWVSD